MTDLMAGMEQGREEAEKAGYASKGGDWYKFTEGSNGFRVLTPFVAIFEDFKDGVCFTGCGFEGSPKQMCYVLDMLDTDVDGKSEPSIKLAKLPNTIAKTIAGYQHDEDYSFDTLPMPYDVKVNAKGAGTKEVEYTVTPRPQRTDVPEQYLKELATMTPIEDIVLKMKEKNATKHGVVLPSQQAEAESLAESADQNGYPEGPEGEPTI